MFMTLDFPHIMAQHIVLIILLRRDFTVLVERERHKHGI
jgi:hypothetical protein